MDGESHGRRSLAGYKESDTVEKLSVSLSLETGWHDVEVPGLIQILAREGHHAPLGWDTPCLNLRRVRARGRRAGASGGLAPCVSSLSGLCNLHPRPARAGGGGCGEQPEKGCPRPEDSRCGSRAGLAGIQLGPGRENLPAATAGACRYEPLSWGWFVMQ